MSDALQVFFGGAAGAAIVVGVFDIAKFLLDRRAKKKDKAENKEDSITSGVRMLMYTDIKDHGKSYIARGSITSEELEDLITLHEVYHNELNGNGFLDKLMEQVKSLPIHN